jgi:hypothetical protein
MLALAGTGNPALRGFMSVVLSAYSDYLHRGKRRTLWKVKLSGAWSAQ